jgi:hypothetical protein
MGNIAYMMALGLLMASNSARAIQVDNRASSTGVPGRSDHLPGHVHRVTGRVIDDLTGKPLSGAKVTLWVVTLKLSIPCVKCGPPPSPPHNEEPRVAVTGNDGKFEFDTVPEKMIEVRASKAGYVDLLRPRIGTEPPSVADLTRDRNFVVRLAPSASISGIARTHTGSPLGSNGDIALYIVTYWSGWPQTQYVGWPKRNSNGTYRFGNLEPGRYFLVVSPPWNRPEPEQIEGGRALGEVPVRYPHPTAQHPSPFFTLREGEHKKLDLELPEESLHHVTMTASPAPVLQVWSQSGGIYSLHEQDRQKGIFDAWLPDGFYWPTNRRPGEIDGPIPFEVAGADVSGLRFESAETGTTRLPVTVQSSIDGSPDLGCGPFPADECEIATLYLLYLDPERSTEVANNIALTPSTKPIATTLLPGRYSAVVLAQRNKNLYVRSIRCGTMDLSQGPMVIHQAEPPAPIQVELAQAGEVNGVVQRNGRAKTAYVYALPVSDTATADYRLFTPVKSKDDGTFVIQGLAPGPWVIFATDAELALDVHDPADTAYWRDHGSVVNVAAGRPAHLLVVENHVPER